ncbi:MAG: hypothetical protein H6510_07195 [Acidobacteria bacterium]|nr:hypothetical protein [Acidobacteriota bacterium]MCB9397581.1 hypothetical protein [Acidobacteriota bacterium]
MQNEDLYLAPKSAGALSDSDELSLSEATLLHSYSRVIGFLGVMWLFLGTVLAGIPLMVARPPGHEFLPLEKMVFFGLSGLYLTGAVGLFMRPAWARYVGLGLCVLGLLSVLLAVNVVTLMLSSVGLYCLIKSPKLFGPNRMTHTELKIRKSRKR